MEDQKIYNSKYKKEEHKTKAEGNERKETNDFKCHFCKEKGHFIAKCPKRMGEKKVNTITTQEEFIVDMKIQNTKRKVLVDTGAEISLVNEKILEPKEKDEMLPCRLKMTHFK